MIRITGLRARFAILGLLVCAFLSFLIIGPYNVGPSNLALRTATTGKAGHSSGAVLTGHAIAPKLGNATAKYVYPNLRARGCSASLEHD
jgi:hypothetical protein